MYKIVFGFIHTCTAACVNIKQRIVLRGLDGCQPQMSVVVCY